jgi:hypothetical protein
MLCSLFCSSVVLPDVRIYSTVSKKYILTSQNTLFLFNKLSCWDTAFQNISRLPVIAFSLQISELVNIIFVLEFSAVYQVQLVKDVGIFLCAPAFPRRFYPFRFYDWAIACRPWIISQRSD